MITLLRIDASARTTRSLSRALADRFESAWKAARPGDTVLKRDVGINPPPAISEPWIAAAFTPEAERTPAQRQLLEESDRMIDELAQADVLVIATPMYNYGMPAALKAWVDQVIRVDRTFTFDLARGDWPLEPVLGGKTMVLLTSSGEFGFGRGCVRAHMNHLRPHFDTLARYLGVSETHQIAIEYQEFGDARHRASVEAAHVQVPQLVERLSRCAVRGRTAA